MNKKTLDEKLASRAFRELLAIGFITLILIGLGIAVDWTEATLKFLYQLQNTVLDDIAVPLIITGFLLSIYTYRRYNEKAHLIKRIEQTKSKLKTAHKRLEVLTQSTSAIVINTKATGRFDPIYTSENITHVLGYSIDEIFRKGFWSENLHPEDAVSLFEQMPVMLKSGGINTQFRFKHKDGSWRWIQAKMKCIYGEEGNPEELFGNWWDITKEKQNEEQLQTVNERFELSYKATGNVLYDWNMDTNHQWMSNELYSTYGYKKEDVTEDINWWASQIHPDDNDALINSLTTSYFKKTRHVVRRVPFSKGRRNLRRYF